jgi:hypothetical protein
MKPPLSRLPPEDGLPDYRDAHNFFGEIWVKYPLATHLVRPDLPPIGNRVDKLPDSHLPRTDISVAHEAQIHHERHSWKGSSGG